MGGTSIKAGIIENGKLVEALSVPTPAEASSLEVINTLEDFISGFDPSSIEAI
jgi:hypothetical protein